MRGGIIVYTEYQSVCPIVGMSPPWTQRREEQHSPGEWVVEPNLDDCKKAWHSVYSVAEREEDGEIKKMM